MKITQFFLGEFDCIIVNENNEIYVCGLSSYQMFEKINEKYRKGDDYTGARFIGETFFVQKNDYNDIEHEKAIYFSNHVFLITKNGHIHKKNAKDGFGCSFEILDFAGNLQQFKVNDINELYFVLTKDNQLFVWGTDSEMQSGTKIEYDIENVTCFGQCEICNIHKDRIIKEPKKVDLQFLDSNEIIENINVLMNFTLLLTSDKRLFICGKHDMFKSEPNHFEWIPSKFFNDEEIESIADSCADFTIVKTKDNHYIVGSCCFIGNENFIHQLNIPSNINIDTIKCTAQAIGILTKENELHIMGKNEYGQFGDIDCEKEFKKINCLV